MQRHKGEIEQLHRMQEKVDTKRSYGLWEQNEEIKVYHLGLELNWECIKRHKIYS